MGSWLRSIFSRLDYPIGFIDKFIQNIATKPIKKTDDGNTIRTVLPFKDQIAANAVRRQLRDLSGKIGVTLQPIFVSKKLEQDLKPKEIKSSIVSQHCVIYKFACDLCDADYVGYTARHLHQRIAEHKYSAIGKHLLDAHGDKNLLFFVLVFIENSYLYLKNIHTASFYLIMTSKNVETSKRRAFLTFFKNFLNVFKKSFLGIFYS